MYSTFLEIIKNDYKNVFIFITFLCLMFMTISLNLFIIIVVIQDKSLRNFTNIQFASMSCADLIVGLVAMPSMLVNTLYGYWPLGDNLCILFILGDFIGGNISIITLAIISYHRLQCIRHPYGMKKYTLFEMLFPALIVWPLVITFWTLPTIYIIKNQKYRSVYDNLKFVDQNYVFKLKNLI